MTSGRLRAALDVTDPEPLPSGHPLGRQPEVLLTPHVGAFADDSVAFLVWQPHRYARFRRSCSRVRPALRFT
ncbi:hypothetical protein ACZ91_45405 [Streptomyces regensis]|nr:hypothetical protein ACZ91_45405 [Streptomyces regensis]